MSAAGRPGPRQFPLLRVGERVRLAPGGALMRVARVNACAAYLKAVHTTPVEVVLPDGRTFLAKEGGGLVAVSPRAAVYREEVS